MRERGKMQRMRVRSRPMSENELEQEQGRVNMRVRIEQRLKGRREECSGDEREGWEDCEEDEKIRVEWGRFRRREQD